MKWSPLIFYALFKFQFLTCIDMFTGKITADGTDLMFNKKCFKSVTKDISLHLRT